MKKNNPKYSMEYPRMMEQLKKIQSMCNRIPEGGERKELKKYLK